MSRAGRVVLVGAGPGAPDLITVRGERALRRAEVVVYDALASPALLDLAPPEAERVNVGKRGHDAPTRTQDDINALLVSRAREGRTVVRLKGGDPFVFGRGGEEVSACIAAGIPVEVVPGVSSALAAPAAAGVPLTDRRHAASFAVVTGHKDPTRVRENIDWEGLARSVDTIVVLMGMRNLGEITGRLLAAGRAPGTPAAVVMHGTTPEQRVLDAPLGELAHRAAEAGLGGPAAVVVGDVVRLRAEFGDLAALPLAGVRVLVTRAGEQAAPWARALAALGALPETVPMIQIESISASPEIEAAVSSLGAYEAQVLTSANAAREWAQRLRERGADPGAPRPRVLVVGPVTERAAREAGFRPEPAVGGTDAGALLERILSGGGAAGRCFLLPGAEAGRPVLPEGLRAAEARVDVVPVYRTVAAPFDRADLNRRLVRGDFDALTFASPSAARPFVAALGAKARAACGGAVVAAIGPVTAEALRAGGLPPDAVAERAEVGALVEALVQALRGKRGGTP